MTQDDRRPATPDAPREPGSRARRVAASRAERRPVLGRGNRSRGRRKAPQPGRTVFRVIVTSLLALAMATGIGVVLVYNNWNGNLDRASIAAQLKDRPDKQKVAGPQEPMNILVMGSDTRSGEGNGIDGESGGGLSDTTILFHLSADRKFAYGVSIPRDTAVIRPTCYREDGSEIPAATGFEKWNAAYSVGGPACTVQQFEQLSGVRVDKYVVVDFNQFKDMVNALDGVEVCIPEDIDDPAHDVHLKAGTREIRDQEALTYVRARYKIGDGTDPNRTRRQQAFIGSMLNKALTAGMLTRPDRLISFMNAASSSLHTDFKSFAQMAKLGVTAKGIGADNIKFVTTPWIFSDKVSAGVEWTPAVDKLWQLIIKDRPLTPEFLEDSISAGDKPDGSATTTDPSAGTSTDTGTPGKSDGTPSSPGTTGAEGPDPSGPASPPEGGLSADGRAAAGLCT